MNSPNFYSGDLAAINAGQVAENDSNTRSEDSLRRYLAEQARTRAHLQQTNNYRDVGMRDADVRREIGLGEIGGRRYATDKTAETAALQAAIEKELGLKGYETQGSITDKTLQAQLAADLRRAADRAAEAKALREFQLKQAQLELDNLPPSEAAVGMVVDQAKLTPELQAVADNLNANLPAVKKKHKGWFGDWDLFGTPELVPGEQTALIPEQYRGKISIGQDGTASPITQADVPFTLTDTPASRRMRIEALNGIRGWEQSGNPKSAAMIKAIENRYQQATGQRLR